jgi:hypothetical protein
MVILSVIGAAWSLFLSFQSQTPGLYFARRASRRGRRFNFWTIFYVEASSSPITERDDEGNTYHSRKLADGTCHRVQNCPCANDLIKTVDGIGKNPRDQQSDYYWVFQYEPVASA